MGGGEGPEQQGQLGRTKGEACKCSSQKEVTSNTHHKETLLRKPQGDSRGAETSSSQAG